MAESLCNLARFNWKSHLNSAFTALFYIDSPIYRHINDFSSLDLAFILRNAGLRTLKLGVKCI